MFGMRMVCIDLAFCTGIGQGTIGFCVFCFDLLSLFFAVMTAGDVEHLEAPDGGAAAAEPRWQVQDSYRGFRRGGAGARDRLQRRGALAGMLRLPSCCIDVEFVCE